MKTSSFVVLFVCFLPVLWVQLLPMPKQKLRRMLVLLSIFRNKILDFAKIESTLPLDGT